MGTSVDKMISLMCCQGLMILGEVHGVLPVGELMMQIYCLALKIAETWQMEIGGRLGGCQSEPFGG